MQNPEKYSNFLRAFSDNLGVECRKLFQVYRTLIFFLNYSENHRFLPGGSMEKIIGIFMLNILLFISYREGMPLRRQKSFKFFLNKV